MKDGTINSIIKDNEYRLLRVPCVNWSVNYGGPTRPLLLDGRSVTSSKYRFPCIQGSDLYVEDSWVGDRSWHDLCPLSTLYSVTGARTPRVSDYILLCVLLFISVLSLDPPIISRAEPQKHKRQRNDLCDMRVWVLTGSDHIVKRSRQYCFVMFGSWNS